MSTFTFTDFLVFTGATHVNEDAYLTIAKGVLSYVTDTYKIFPEEETLVQNTFLTSGQLSIIPKAFPVNSITSVTYDGDEVTYTYYGEDILLDTTVADVRIPLVVTMEVGYTSSTLPAELQLAIYRHIVAVFQSIDKHVDNISKIVNTDGNSTYYRNDVLPKAVKQVYDYYAGYALVL